MSKETLSLCKHGVPVKYCCTSCMYNDPEEYGKRPIIVEYDDGMPNECLEDMLNRKW